MSAETKKRESIVESVVALDSPDYDSAVTITKINALVEEGEQL